MGGKRRLIPVVVSILSLVYSGCGEINPPLMLHAHAKSSNKIKLVWKAMSGQNTGFIIERIIDGDFAEIDRVEFNATTYTDNDLFSLTTYTYRIKAYELLGSRISNYSNEASVTTFDGVPPAPSMVSVARIERDSAMLQWTDNSSNETSFEVQQRSASAEWTPVKQLSADTESVLITNLMPHQEYHFRVHAINDFGSAHSPKKICVPVPFTNRLELSFAGRQTDGRFSQGISLVDDRIVVGAPYMGDESRMIFGCGAVYITGSVTATLFAIDANTDDHFGASVSSDYHSTYEYTVAIGAPEDDDDGWNSGSVYTFSEVATDSWSGEVEIHAPDAANEDAFGYSVDLDGDYLIVGAPRADTTADDTGAAYVFLRTGLDSWDTGFKLLPGDLNGGDAFGAAVSIFEDLVAVAAPLADSPDWNAGAVYIYERTGPNMWEQRARVTADDASSYDSFGFSIDLTSDALFIGAPFVDTGVTSIDSGAVYEFKKVSSSSWPLENKFQLADSVGGEELGIALAAYGDHLVTGSISVDGEGQYGWTVGLYWRSSSNEWIKFHEIEQSSSVVLSNFTITLAISQDYLVAGVPLDDSTNGNRTGEVFAFF